LTYLQYYMVDPLLEEHELIPFCDEKGVSFMSPNPTTYDRYLAHIDSELKTETPMTFGLHPNAEIDFRTTQSVQLFKTLEDLAPKQTGGDNGEMTSPTHIAENVLNDIMETYNDDTFFSLEDIDDMLEGEKGPFQNVFIQECDQMNTLMHKVLDTLAELKLGFAGELTMSDAMESLMESLYMNRVPVPWSKLAWPSERALDGWLRNLNARIRQLNEWTEAPLQIPQCTWLSGLQNPQSFLTAIMQQTAQANQLELDKLMVITDVTKHEIEGLSSHARDGAYIHGLFLEGARWNKDRTELERAKPREMYCPMPVIVVKAVPAASNLTGIYACPVYKTARRGPTFVFEAQLKTKFPSAKWVMAGVALLMDVEV